MNWETSSTYWLHSDVQYNHRIHNILLVTDSCQPFFITASATCFVAVNFHYGSWRDFLHATRALRPDYGAAAHPWVSLIVAIVQFGRRPGTYSSIRYNEDRISLSASLSIPPSVIACKWRRHRSTIAGLSTPTSFFPLPIAFPGAAVNASAMQSVGCFL